MLTEERKKKIVELVESNGIVRIRQLAEVFDVSVYTIRRDLTDLEKKGLIKKTHGGAIKVEKSMWLSTIEEGQKEAITEKQAIAKKASSYIENGDTIFLMGSTISLMIIPYISSKSLTVVTNSISIAQSLCQYENIETIILGGRVKNYKGNILGSHAIFGVQKFYFDKSIISCAGIHSRNGITTSTLDSSDFTRAIINCSAHNILTADYRKIGRVTFSKICDINQIDRLITDNKADSHELEEISKKRVIIDIVSL